MNKLTSLLGIVACTTIVSSAQAAFITFGNQTLWNQFVTGSGWQVATETFNGVADGFYAGSYSGSVSGINWTGSATGGIYAQGGLFSTNNPVQLDFSFSPGVQGVGGNIFGTDFSFNVVPCIIQVTLADGSSYVNYATTSTDFVGFYSTGAAIASMSIQTTATGAGSVYATVDNLYFTVVPAPGSLALLGLAGLGAAARRRR
ncbi:MAG: PEP-CTERM sorting domain-containing protein [Planctomycetes bacterium]|nr:PEP-CTERM sorting domain-containing protein [Planctomycetota bacterium]